MNGAMSHGHVHAQGGIDMMPPIAAQAARAAPVYGELTADGMTAPSEEGSAMSVQAEPRETP